MVADRTRSRYGRYRPYLLFGGLPLTLCFLAMFLGPGGGGTSAVAFAAATHVVFRSLYAVINIPNASLFARVTRDARVRADLTGFRMVFATLGAVAVAGMTLPLVKSLGTPDFPRRGWVVLAAIYGLSASLVLLAVAWAGKGYDSSAEAAAPRPPLRAAFRSLPANRALLIVLGAVVISSFLQHPVRQEPALLLQVRAGARGPRQRRLGPAVVAGGSHGAGLGPGGAALGHASRLAVRRGAGGERPAALGSW